MALFLDMLITLSDEYSRAELNEVKGKVDFAKSRPPIPAIFQAVIGRDAGRGTSQNVLASRCRAEMDAIGDPRPSESGPSQVRVRSESRMPPRFSSPTCG